MTQPATHSIHIVTTTQGTTSTRYAVVPKGCGTVTNKRPIVKELDPLSRIEWLAQHPTFDLIPLD